MCATHMTSKENYFIYHGKSTCHFQEMNERHNHDKIFCKNANVSLCQIFIYIRLPNYATYLYHYHAKYSSTKSKKHFLQQKVTINSAVTRKIYNDKKFKGTSGFANFFSRMVSLWYEKCLLKCPSCSSLSKLYTYMLSHSTPTIKSNSTSLLQRTSFVIITPPPPFSLSAILSKTLFFAELHDLHMSPFSHIFPPSCSPTISSTLLFHLSKLYYYYKANYTLKHNERVKRNRYPFN